MTKPSRMLVLEDEEEIAELVCEVARTMGIACASVGRPGIFFEQLTPDVELVAIDLSMPEMTGEQVMWRLAQQGCRARVMIMSGAGTHTLAQARRYGLTLGLDMAETLAKPFRVTELMARLRG